jgi:ABC-type sugar transport system ATPase subunit
MYTLQNIKITHGNFILQVPNLQLKPHNLYVLVGANGAGKTTLLNFLAFIKNSYEGTLLFNKSIVNQKRKGLSHTHRRQMSYLIQNPYLFSMSVFDNVAYGLKIRGFSKEKIKEKVNTILQQLALTHLSDRKPNALSGGEKQRVALARALVIDADAYLLDEPTANVDEVNIEMVEKMIIDIYNTRKPLIILSTHSQIQANRLSENIISIFEGKINNLT